MTFDRGTILIEAPPEAGLERLPDVRWDGRVGRYRAPAFRYRDLIVALRADASAFANEVLGPGLRPAVWNVVELRPYQEGALLAWMQAKRGLLVLPTGSGKTRVACAAMAACGAATLCLVPTRALLHQWRTEISRHYRGPLGCLGDGQHTVEPVTVATFEAAYSQMQRIGNRFGMLVVDEVHHFGNRARDEALEMCTAARRLGLTATAPEPDALDALATMVGPVVCEVRLAELAGRWLADFEVVVLGLSLSPSEREHYAAAVERFLALFTRHRAVYGDFAWGEFVASASRTEEGRAALEAFKYSRKLANYPDSKRSALAGLLARHRDGRVLVFTPDNETAHTIAREQLITPITCDIERSEREEALAAFRSGVIRTLVSAQVLNEGIDVPGADVAIIVGGMRGGREHVQRVGRLLRPVLGKRAIVYELVSVNIHEERKANARRRALRATG